MKKYTFLSLILICLCSIDLISQNRPTLQEGTVVRIRLLETLDSRTAQSGNHVYMEVADNVEVGNVVLIEAGAKVMGTILAAHKAKMLGRKGELSFSVDYTVAANGKNIRLRSVSSNSGKDHVGGVVTAAVLVSPLMVFIKGKNITINKGAEFPVYVDRDYELQF